MITSKVERNIVVVLFLMVLVAFSFAERDSKKLDKLYTVSGKIMNNVIASVNFR